MSVYNPHCDSDELGDCFARYLPLCRSVSGDMARRGYDSDQIYEAAVRGLELAARRWNPNQASCPVRCQLCAGEASCAHGGVRVTLGAYAHKFIWGEVVVEIRRASRAPVGIKEQPVGPSRPGARDQPGFRPPVSYDYDADPGEDVVLQDGSAPDGSEAGGRWCASDRGRLVELIETAIVGGRLVVSGLSAAKLRGVIASLSDGRSFAETATLVKCSDKAVARAVAALRDLLAGTDFAAHEAETRVPKRYSLRQVVEAICARYYPDSSSKTRQTIAKRVGEWAIVGRVSATRGADHRWIFSPLGFTRCLELWQDLAAAETGGRR